MQNVLAGAGCLLMFAYGVAQLVAGFLGIDYHLGAIWASLLIFASLMLRFTLPITLGAFFGAMDVWGWHWALAGLFAAPGLLLIIPTVLSLLVTSLTRVFSRDA